MSNQDLLDNIQWYVNKEEDDDIDNSNPINIDQMRRSQRLPISSKKMKEQNLRNTMDIKSKNWSPNNSWMDNGEWNKKHFPSKANVCKGLSSSNVNKFILPGSNSPIVQYYAGAMLNNNDIDDFKQIQMRKEWRDSMKSTNSQIFNYSPSAIFNKNKEISNSSLLNINNTPYKWEEYKSWNDKLNESNEIESDAPEEMINKAKTFQIEKMKEEDDQELYMLAFNSDDDVGNYNNIYAKKNYQTSEDETNNSMKYVGKNTPIQFAMNQRMKIPKNEDKGVNLKEKTQINQVEKDIIHENEDKTNEKKKNEYDNVMEGNERKEVNNEELDNTKTESKLNTRETIEINDQSYSNKIAQGFQDKSLIDSGIQNNGYTNISDLQWQQISDLGQGSYYSTYFNNYYLEQNSTSNPQNTIELSFSANSQQRKQSTNSSFASMSNINNLNSFYPTGMQQPHQQRNQNNKNAKKIKRWDPSEYTDKSLEELANNWCNLAKDQGACRYLQNIWNENPENVINHLYPALVDGILLIINDPFANYLIQKWFPPMSENQISQILQVLSPHVFDIGANPHGTRVLQAIIPNLSTVKLRQYFLSIITPHIIPLLKELNGTHVVQKFAADYPEFNPFINKIIAENSHNLATHRHGCCVIQKYLEMGEAEMITAMLDKLIKNCLMLIIDQFGNYVIQSIWQLNRIECGNAITNWVTENICYYAKHKYSSNVIEKWFDHCDAVVKQRLILSLLRPETIHELILDEHGNYIIQKVLSCIDLNTQAQVLQIIIPLFSQIKCLSYGDKIINKLLMTYPQLVNYIPGGGLIMINNMGNNSGNYKKSVNKKPYKNNINNHKNYNKSNMSNFNNNSINSSSMNRIPDNYYGNHNSYSFSHNTNDNIMYNKNNIA